MRRISAFLIFAVFAAWLPVQPVHHVKAVANTTPTPHLLWGSGGTDSATCYVGGKNSECGPALIAKDRISGRRTSGQAQEINPITIEQDRIVFLPFLWQNYYNLRVDIQDRAASQKLYEQYYLPFFDAEIQWTGNHDSCNAGSAGEGYRNTLLRLVKYFRAMAGVPADITFSEAYNSKAQQAALMMSVNRQLSHTPDTSWQCYTDAGAEAAQHANLSLWYGYGKEYHGILGQMSDDGAYNSAVGHRRWILYPQTRHMGSGDVPERGEYYSANALWVIDEDTIWGPRPRTRHPFVAWPPPGYVPRQVTFGRWYFSYDEADLSNTTITMSRAGSAVAVRLEPIRSGFGENTIVWVPAIDWDGLPPDQDHRFHVEVRNVVSTAHKLEYDVTVFDPSHGP